MRKLSGRIGARLILGFVVTFQIGCDHEPRVDVPVFNRVSTPITGPDVEGIERFDDAIIGLMRKWNLPGAAFAVAKDGKLIVARGYGYADYESRQTMQPDSMFRIASISKTITAAAILRFVEQGLLDLDRPFLDVLTDYQVPADGDQRLRAITLRHLLQHSGGWDRTVAADPLFDTPRIAGVLGVPTPLTCTQVAQYMLSQPLQFDPGSRVEYSNVGACFLGRVIERVSGRPYEHYIRNDMLAQMDVYGMSIGHGELARRGPYEVKYYMNDGAPFMPSPFPGGERVPETYAHDMLTFEGSGGWIGSAIDVTRIATAIDGSRMRFLNDATLAQMIADPHLPGLGSNYWFGLGVLVGPTPTTWSKSGLLPGAQSLVVHNRNGYVWAFITNGRAPNTGAFQDELVAQVGEPLIDGLAGSATDLYLEYPSPSLPARNP